MTLTSGGLVLQGRQDGLGGAAAASFLSFALAGG